MFGHTAKYFPAQPKRRIANMECNDCKYLSLLINNENIYLKNADNDWSCTGDQTLIFSKTSEIKLDYTRDQWSLRDAKNDSGIFLFTREFDTKCPSNIRNMFLPKNPGSKFSDIKKFDVFDNHDNIPNCLSDENCWKNITVNDEEFVEKDGVFTSYISSTKIYRDCKNWVVDKNDRKKYVPFSTKAGYELCLYNLSSIGDEYCSSVLYFGSTKLIYNRAMGYYQGSRIILRKQDSKPGWEITLDGSVPLFHEPVPFFLQLL